MIISNNFIDSRDLVAESGVIGTIDIIDHVACNK